MIRPAQVQDLDRMLEMLKSFASASLINYSEWTEQDLASARQRLTNMIINHYLIVAERAGELVGMIGAMREQDPWIRSHTRMRELFWWVEPEHRRSRVSAELFVRWEADAAKWLEKNMVNSVSLSTQPGSSDIDLSRRGWRCVEQHWIKE
jgi:N-acetylglutamate synthase-like GNAT family acetyltransferase